MKFKKEDLKRMLIDDHEELKKVEDSIDDVTRWSIVRSCVFSYKDKFYSVGYSEGATETQCEEPFEYDGDDIICGEVVPTQVTVTQYVSVKKDKPQ